VKSSDSLGKGLDRLGTRKYMLGMGSDRLVEGSDSLKLAKNAVFYFVAIPFSLKQI